MIPDSIYPLQGSFSSSRWRAQLGAVLDLQEDAAHSLQKTYCDSFDWGLHGAGLYLEKGSEDGRAMLRLMSVADGTAVIEGMADGGERFWWDLPVSPLRERLRELLDIRALLPRYEVSIRSYCLRQVDSEGKTRVRLFVESCRWKTGDGRSRVILNRLRLQPVRGYDKAANRIRRYLEKKHKLKAGPDTLYGSLLKVSEARPGAYSNKLKLSLKPDTRADAAAREVLVSLEKAMDENYQGTIDDLDTEFLHDFRVAVRRTRSMLSEVKTVFPAAALKRFRAEFAWLGGLTSEVRDLDVYLLKFERYQQAVPVELRQGLVPLRDFLVKLQRHRQTTHLAPALKSARYRRLRDQWHRFLEAPLAKRPTAPDAGREIGEVARRRTWRMYKRVMREGAAIHQGSPHEALHELRKSGKKLRYLMEFFQSLFAADDILALIKELKRLQDNLGDFQDLEVQIQSLGQFEAEMRGEAELAAETELAFAALEAALKKEMATVRAHFEERFKRFAQDDTRARFKQLFRPAAANKGEA